MKDLYDIVPVGGGWAYLVNGMHSEAYLSYAEALKAAAIASKRMWNASSQAAALRATAKKTQSARKAAD